MAAILAARPAGADETGWVGGWSPGIGDPAAIGWITVAGYLVAAWLCYRVSIGHSPDAGNVRSTAWRERRLWRVLGGVLVALGLNKQLDLQSAVTEALRIVAREQGWYRFTRDYQSAFIELLAIVTLTGTGGLVAFTWKRSRSVKIAGLGLCCLGAFVLLRAASFHHMDALIHGRVLSLKLDRIMELGGIGVVGLGAAQRLVQSAQPSTTELRPKAGGGVPWRVGC
ncbi:MAG: hypothetical protein H6Q28_1433 [Bacteroidetes bacterium]|nr:hypothetical protein [Bacteroidota bacterium]